MDKYNSRLAKDRKFKRPGGQTLPGITYGPGHRFVNIKMGSVFMLSALLSIRIAAIIMAVIFFFEKGVDILYAKAYNMDVLKKSTKNT